MSHLYLLPIRGVKRAADGSPASFIWRGERYRVLEVFSTWHLRDRWWESGNPFTGRGASDRFYYLVLCTKELLCEVYYDRAQNTWVMEHIMD
jgi:hypothetical protein